VGDSEIATFLKAYLIGEPQPPALSTLFMHQSLTMQVKKLFPQGLARVEIPTLLKRLMMDVPMEYWDEIAAELFRCESNSEEEAEAFIQLLREYNAQAMASDRRAIADTKTVFGPMYAADLKVTPLHDSRRQALSAKMDQHMSALQERYMLQFLLLRGLTPERFEGLVEKYSYDSDEAKQLYRDCKAFSHKRPEGNKKL
jgi:hypothetical protein